MPPVNESAYKDLLNPIKDNEKAFSVNIAELLQKLIEDLEGDSRLNFNSAALILQGSASVYGKKVEFLHTLASQFYSNLQKQGNAEEKQQQNKKETKEREKKGDKPVDLFPSEEFQIGKRLSILKKKVFAKGTPKKASKSSKGLIAPVPLLSNDSEKGELFYDTTGESIGHRGDHALNRCRLIKSGWFLLPIVNSELVPSLSSVPDYYDDFDCDIGNVQITDENTDLNDIHASPDTGFESCPPSSDVQESIPDTPMESDCVAPSSADTPIESDCVAPSSADTPIETASVVDEGIGCTPSEEVCNSPGSENVPTEDAALSSAPEPVRTVRRNLRSCLGPGDDPLYGITIHKDLFKRRKVEKKNCRCLPQKIKRSPDEEVPIESIASYCARTFFCFENPTLEKSILKLEVEAFRQCSPLYKRLVNRLSVLKARKSKTVAPIEDERKDVEAIVKEANEDDETLNVPFDDNDLVIEKDNDSKAPDAPPPEPHLKENGKPDLPSPDITQLTWEESQKTMHLHLNENSDIAQTVQEWNKSLKPFLDELEHRENFDINLYGSRILNSFEDNNRKQTITFRDFCKNKEKWEIHRSFMALLPLANVGNVSLESEFKEDGTEEINVTLLSRKMHHKELEEFGHNDGSHS